VANEQALAAIRRGYRAWPGCRGRDDRRRSNVHGSAGDERRSVRTQLRRTIGGRRLQPGGHRLGDDAAARVLNRCGSRRFVLLHRGGAAARRPYLPVEPAQILRPRERDRWQQHHQREGGQNDAAHDCLNHTPGSSIPQRASEADQFQRAVAPYPEPTLSAAVTRS